MMELEKIAERILEKRKEVPAEKALLAGISGIDGSGKGFVTAKLAGLIKGLNVAVINIDGWLNLPHVRFDPSNPAEHFYKSGIRFEEMFEKLVLPLKNKRSVTLTADFAEETATEFRKETYLFENTDVIMLEGIFLLKTAFRESYDLTVWVDCSFETALERAVGRSQEGLPPEETVEAYQTIYFPAQRIRFDLDRPRENAGLIFNNDRKSEQFKVGK